MEAKQKSKGGSKMVEPVTREDIITVVETALKEVGREAASLTRICIRYNMPLPKMKPTKIKLAGNVTLKLPVYYSHGPLSPYNWVAVFDALPNEFLGSITDYVVGCMYTSRTLAESIVSAIRPLTPRKVVAVIHKLQRAAQRVKGHQKRLLQRLQQVWERQKDEVEEILSYRVYHEMRETK